jgi:hypothetical protein
LSEASSASFKKGLLAIWLARQTSQNPLCSIELPQTTAAPSGNSAG